MPNPRKFKLKGKLASTVKVGEKGQIVIPKDMRDMMEISPGDALLILCDEKKGIAIPVKSIQEKMTNMAFGGFSADGQYLFEEGQSRQPPDPDRLDADKKEDEQQ